MFIRFSRLLFNYHIYLEKKESNGKETPLGEWVVRDLRSGYDFEGKHLYFNYFFASFGLLEKLKLQNVETTRTIRPDRAGIPSNFVGKNKI